VRVVLDNCVPRRLRRRVVGHNVRTVGELGWGDTDDGRLLDLLADGCDAFVTVDQNLPYQQRLAHRPFAVIVLCAKSNRLADLEPLAPALLDALSRAMPGTVTHLSV
jgi:hypothetical protein